MTRFWPIWTCYGLIWTLMQPLQFLVASRNGHESLANLARDIPRTLNTGVAISFAFGIFAAMAVFSYLFSSRPACMMHSLPLDRNALFLTNYISGLSFLVLPNLAAAALTLLLETAYGCLAPGALLIWLLIQSATGLFFYSFAVFCAMFTGNAFALPAFYVILNFLCEAVYSLTCEVLSLLLYGAHSWGNGAVASAVAWLTPASRLSNACRARLIDDGGEISHFVTVSSPGEAAVYAAVGVALALLALAVYRRRHIESAGDVVAVPLVRPVFKYGVALCAGLSFGSYTAVILDLYEAFPLALFVILWAVIGYFVAEMLLRKSFRVWKRWKGAAVLACLLAALFTAVELDWFGYESRVPGVDQVRSVRIYGLSGAPDDGANDFLELTSPEQITEALRLHRAIVEHRDRAEQPGDDSIWVTFYYTLADGTAMSRRYSGVPVWAEDADIPGTVASAAQQLLSDRDYVRGLYQMDKYQDMRLVEAYLTNIWREGKGFGDDFYLDASAGQLEKLWQAVRRDFDEGTIGVRYLFSNSQERYANTCTADLCFSWDTGETMRVHDADRDYAYPATEHFRITLTPQASHTLAVLRELGVLDQVELVTHLEAQGKYS